MGVAIIVPHEDGTVSIVLAVGTAFKLVLKIVPVPEHRVRAPSLNRALYSNFEYSISKSSVDG